MTNLLLNQKINTLFAPFHQKYKLFLMSVLGLSFGTMGLLFIASLFENATFNMISAYCFLIALSVAVLLVVMWQVYSHAEIKHYMLQLNSWPEKELIYRALLLMIVKELSEFVPLDKNMILSFIQSPEYFLTDNVAHQKFCKYLIQPSAALSVLGNKHYEHWSEDKIKHYITQHIEHYMYDINPVRQYDRP